MGTARKNKTQDKVEHYVIITRWIHVSSPWLFHPHRRSSGLPVSSPVRDLQPMLFFRRLGWRVVQYQVPRAEYVQLISSRFVVAPMFGSVNQICTFLLSLVYFLSYVSGILNNAPKSNYNSKISYYPFLLSFYSRRYSFPKTALSWMNLLSLMSTCSPHKNKRTSMTCCTFLLSK